MLNTLFTFYLENRGWLAFAILPVVIFLLMLIDNQRNQRGAIGWLAGVFICLLLFLPAVIYDLGPVETREALTDVRLLLFYVGILGLILPIMLFVGYIVSYRSSSSQQNNNVAPRPNLGMPPQSINVNVHPQPINVNVPPQGSINNSADSLPTMMDNRRGQQAASAPASPYQADDEKPTQIDVGKRASIASHNAPLLNAWLIDENNQNNRYQLRAGRTTIGRGQKHDINITNDTVSRNGHAVITYDDGQFTIRDLGAVSGVKLNEYAINGATELHHNTVITLGEVNFKFISS